MQLSNGVVHEHVRNMSMANVLASKRPALADIKKPAPQADEIQRSPLADLLYLRCRLIHRDLVGVKLTWSRAGWIAAKVARDLGWERL